MDHDQGPGKGLDDLGGAYLGLYWSNKHDTGSCCRLLCMGSIGDQPQLGRLWAWNVRTRCGCAPCIFSRFCKKGPNLQSPIHGKLTCIQRPFVNYYGCIFILWELSTPFLNIHWFMDKLNMTGSRAQLYNGMALLCSFFSCRLVYGTYQSVRVFRDVWFAVQSSPQMASLQKPTMHFANEHSTVPLWLSTVYLASNITLNGLNFYWFVMMVKAVRKRFEPNDKSLVANQFDTSSVTSALPDRKGKASRRRA